MNVKKVEVFGESKSIADWSKDPRCHVGSSNLYYRISAGWDPLAAMVVPVHVMENAEESDKEKWRNGKGLLTEWINGTNNDSADEALPIRRFLQRHKMIGKRFGSFVVRDVVHDGDRYQFECECDCGEISRKRIHYLRSLRKDVGSQCRCRRGLGGFSYGPILNKKWLQMRSRCYRKDDKDFRTCGGRGVQICDEWRNSPIAFYEWAMENGWRPGCMILRNSRGLDFSPENCKVVLKVTSEDRQSPVRVVAERLIDIPGVRRTEHEVFLTFQGEEKSLTKWGRDERCVVTSQAVRERLSKGWSVEDALMTPPTGYSMLRAFGEDKNMSEWSRDDRCVVNYSVLRSRIRSGWCPEDAITTEKGAERDS